MFGSLEDGRLHDGLATLLPTGEQLEGRSDVIASFLVAIAGLHRCLEMVDDEIVLNLGHTNRYCRDTCYLIGHYF